MTDEAGSAAGGDVESAPERRRSVWVWLILAWASFLLILAAYFAVAEFMGFQPRGEGSAPLSWLYYLVVLTSAVLCFVGAMALFNLRSKAVPLLAFGLVFNVLDTLILRSEGWGVLPDGVPGAVPGQQLYTGVGAALGLLVFAAILVYSVILRRRAVLR